MKRSIVVRFAVVLSMLAAVALVDTYRREQPHRRDLTPPTRMLAPSAAIPRLAWERVGTSSLRSASDFALVGDRLYVVDRRTPHVAVLRRATTGEWSEVAAFGRAGDGPGEFRPPMGIAGYGQDSGLAVIDARGTLQFFDAAGVYLTTAHFTLPCTVPNPQLVAAGDSSFFIAGDCFAHASNGTDTAYAALLHLRVARPVREIVREARFTVDGSWGSVYGSARPLSGIARMVLFGTGLTNCATEIQFASESLPPMLANRCGLVEHAFVATAPNDLRDARKQQARLRMGSAHALAWPDPLPIYMDKLQTSRGLVLIRLFHADSVVLERVAAAGAPRGTSRPDARYLLVAPLDGFRGCTADGCLWYLERGEGERIAFVRRSELEARIAAAP